MRQISDHVWEISEIVDSRRGQKFPGVGLWMSPPCVLLARMNTFVDLLFHALVFVALLSTGLLVAELRDMMRP